MPQGNIEMHEMFKPAPSDSFIQINMAPQPLMMIPGPYQPIKQKPETKEKKLNLMKLYVLKKRSLAL
jgi:hypothetical protein